MNFRQKYRPIDLLLMPKLNFLDGYSIYIVSQLSSYIEDLILMKSPLMATASI